MLLNFKGSPYGNLRNSKGVQGRSKGKVGLCRGRGLVGGGGWVEDMLDRVWGDGSKKCHNEIQGQHVFF